ncbi:ATP-binding protein [Streptomyces chattanoogensis]|uniref:sensor histidine kinase n=1 Tax=Streptomyces chattanoogensis TaxID=66876 RepID=UPI0036CC1908
MAATSWWSSRPHPVFARIRAALVGGGIAGVLFFTSTQWLTDLNENQPYATADAALRWGLLFIAPTAALLIGTAVWATLGRGAGRVPFRSRLALTAALATALLLLLAVHLLRNVQHQWGNIDNVYWITLTSGVPLVGLLTGLLVHFTADRSLRPVEAIRSQLEAITTSSLDRRVPVPDTEDTIARLALTTNDTLHRLEQATVRQREFIADAAHELRSPLSALRAQLESALRHPKGVDWPTTVESAVADVVRLQGLTNDLLLLAHMDGAQHMKPADDLVDLAAVTEDLVREYHHLPATERLHLAHEAAEDVPPLQGNALHLERLLRNLLDNACRHAGSRVTIKVWADEDAKILVDVIDDGPGIPSPDRQRVFDRFTRLEDARDRASGGAGLGLPIAREIAVRHGGTLTIADSLAGTHMRVRLPSRRVSADAPLLRPPSRRGDVSPSEREA